ncbi:MAG TPA: hypothetical protein VHN13_23715 [Candidatus Tectomicrobia bacterium]|jgi:hypothetical protein|nr:hypothetical protein [Candidatus Tectomicrobia bacterium]
MKPVKTPTQLRLTQDLLERADALIAIMAADPEVRALGMPTRTAVLRLAIARGLRDLERQYQAPAYTSVSPAPAPHDATPRSREGTLSHAYAGRNGEDQAPGSSQDGSGVSAPAPKGP